MILDMFCKTQSDKLMISRKYYEKVDVKKWHFDPNPYNCIQLVTISTRFGHFEGVFEDFEKWWKVVPIGTYDFFKSVQTVMKSTFKTYFGGVFEDFEKWWKVVPIGTYDFFKSVQTVMKKGSKKWHFDPNYT